MDKLRSWRNSLDESLHRKNAFNDLLAKAEEKTKISRVNIILGFVAFIAIYLVFGYGTSFLASLIGFIYPAYKSIKALETHEKDDDTKWLTYWVVFASISIVEAFTDIFFFWIPLYSLMKCAIFLFLMAPTTPNGSILFYEKIIRPYILKHEKKLDQAFEAASDLAGDFANTARKKATEVAEHIGGKMD